jgi:hypothetical protein
MGIVIICKWVLHRGDVQVGVVEAEGDGDRGEGERHGDICLGSCGDAGTRAGSVLTRRLATMRYTA